jgi:WD40 repeat protein
MVKLPFWLSIAAFSCLTLSHSAWSNEAEGPAEPQDSQENGIRPNRPADLPPGAVVRIGKARSRPDRAIASLILSPRANFLASAYPHQPIRLWSPRTRKELSRLDVEAGERVCVVFSPDEKTLALEDQGNIRACAVDSGRETGRFDGKQRAVSSISFSPDGRLFVSAGQAPTFIVWDLQTGKEVRRIDLTGSAGRMTWRTALTEDGMLLACGGGDASAPGYWYATTLGCWQVATGKEVARGKGPEQPIKFAAFSPDGKTCYFGGHDFIEAWKTIPPQRTNSVEQKDPSFISFALSLDGRSIASANWGGIIELWDAKKLKSRKRFAHSGNFVNTITLSSDGQVLAFAEERIIRVWDLKTGQTLGHRFQELDEAIRGVAFAEHGRLLVGVVGDTTIRLWDAKTGTLLREMPDEGIDGSAIAISPDQTLLAAGGKGISLWEISTGKLLHRPRLPYSWVAAVGFSASKRLVAIGGEATGTDPDERISVLDVSTGKAIRHSSLGQKGERPDSIRLLSPDCRMVVSTRSIIWGSAPGHTSPVYLWDLATGRRLRQVGGDPMWADSIAFSPDGKTLAIANSGQPLQLWEVATGKERYQFPIEDGGAMTFSPNGRLLALADSSGRVGFLDLATGKSVPAFMGHDKHIVHASLTRLSFSPDGNFLATGSGDTTVLIWELTGLRGYSNRAVSPPAKELRESWNKLANPDAAKAYRALWELVAASNDAVGLIRKAVRPVASLDSDLARLIADLDSSSFAVREKATQELERLAELARPALERLLESRPSLEVVRRVKQILKKPDAPVSPEQLQALRAVEVLELIGTEEARDVLKELTRGASGARLTTEAMSAWERLSNAITRH